MTTTVRVYTKPDCRQCDATKRRLDEKHIAFEIEDATSPENLAALKAEGWGSAPVVLTNVDGVEVGWAGYRPDMIDELAERIGAGRTTVLTAADFEMKWDAEHTFPFFESEDAVIIGYGHPDKAEFAQLVRQYDLLCSGNVNDEVHHVDEVQHVWGIIDNSREHIDGEWRVTWRDVTAETTGAVPMVVIFR